MNRAELKKALKPMIKECIKEALLEEGILSSIVAEVARGMSQGSVLTEHRDPARDELVLEEKRIVTEQQRQERIKKLNESAGSKLGGVNIFEGTTAIKESGASSNSTAPGALSGIDPRDSGVDISGLAALAGGAWKKTMEKGR